jgi:type I restriction enzyme M protein
MGHMVDTKHRVLTDEEVATISSTYHRWRKQDGKYEDVNGFCKSATFEEINQNRFILSPGRYACPEYVEKEEQFYTEKLDRLIAELNNQIEKSNDLQSGIRDSLKILGYEFK